MLPCGNSPPISLPPWAIKHPIFILLARLVPQLSAVIMENSTTQSFDKLGSFTPVVPVTEISSYNRSMGEWPCPKIRPCTFHSFTLRIVLSTAYMPGRVCVCHINKENITYALIVAYSTQHLGFFNEEHFLVFSQQAASNCKHTWGSGSNRKRW